MDELCRLSGTGKYLAYSKLAGVVRIWDTMTNSLKQEFTSTDGLLSTTVSMSWSDTAATSVNSKSKHSSSQLFLAVGTTTGQVLLYTLTELQSQLVSGHNDRVNDISWHSDSESLYTCSSDKHIIHWSVVESKVLRRWKADIRAIHSICLCTTELHLLSAGECIKLWDLDTQQVLKTFYGHSTEVIQLLELPLVDNDDERCFVSAAKADNIICVWLTNNRSADNDLQLSLSIPDNPCYLTASDCSSDRTIMLAVLSRSGCIHIYHINPTTYHKKQKQPMKCTQTIQIAASADERSYRLPINSVHLSTERLIIAYGTYLVPVCETLLYKDLQQEMTCLIRNDTSRVKIHSDADATKVRTGKINNSTTALTHHELASRHQMTSDKVGEVKRRRKSAEITMEERLTTSERNKSSAPTTDSMTTLLVHGLHSQDKTILNGLLQNTDKQLINNTVQRLPVDSVVLLLQEMSLRMQGHAQSARTSLMWVNAIMDHHTSYLITLPGLLDILNTLHQLMDSRCSMFSRLSKLQGRMDLILSQVDMKSRRNNTVDSQPALLQHQESSDEDITPGGHVVTVDSLHSNDEWQMSDITDDDDDDDDDDEHQMAVSDDDDSTEND